MLASCGISIKKELISLDGRVLTAPVVTTSYYVCSIKFFFKHLHGAWSWNCGLISFFFLINFHLSHCSWRWGIWKIAFLVMGVGISTTRLKPLRDNTLLKIMWSLRMILIHTCFSFAETLWSCKNWEMGYCKLFCPLRFELYFEGAYKLWKN